jgi:cytosine/adenosine deaminase-related metal-dependent hydrolase
MEFALRARWVLPIDGPPIDGGYVTIVDGRIAAVGADCPAGGPIEDCGDVALLPGLVNAHAHLEFSDLATPLGEPGMTLPAWIRLVIGERKRSNRDAAAAIAAGFAESLAAGVTTIGDIATAPPERPDAAAAPTTAAPTTAAPTTVAFQESIGFSARRIDSALADLQRRFELTPPPAGFSPHAPYTVHPQLVTRIVELAGRRSAPVAMHLAESLDERDLLATGGGPFRDLLEDRSMWDGDAIPRGSRWLDYLQQLAEAPRALVIHGNYLAADEMQLLGQRRATLSVVFCPRTHAYFRHAEYPLRLLRAAGVRVALGTDSRASNPDLDLLADLRFAARAREFSAIEPAAWLRMATLDAAEALGLAAEVGSLAPGKRADLVAIACAAAEDPAAAIVRGAGRVERVWLGGHPVGQAC